MRSLLLTTLVLLLLSCVTASDDPAYLILDITTPSSLAGKYVSSPAAYGRVWGSDTDAVYTMVTTEPPTACNSTNLVGDTG